MIGTTLTEIHEHIESLASDDGEFCHRVAAAVFETLSRHGYDAIEY